MIVDDISKHEYTFHTQNQDKFYCNKITQYLRNINFAIYYERFFPSQARFPERILCL